MKKPSVKTGPKGIIKKEGGTAKIKKDGDLAKDPPAATGFGKTTKQPSHFPKKKK